MPRNNRGLRRESLMLGLLSRLADGINFVVSMTTSRYLCRPTKKKRCFSRTSNPNRAVIRMPGTRMERVDCFYSGRGVRGRPRRPRQTVTPRQERARLSVGRRCGARRDEGKCATQLEPRRGWCERQLRSRECENRWKRRRGTLVRPSIPGGGAARGRRACLRIHDARVARTCGGSHNKGRRVALSSPDWSAMTQSEPHGASTAVACGLRLTGLSARWGSLGKNLLGSF